jgi:hypothetical protein
MSGSLAEQELLFLIYKYIESRTSCNETKQTLAEELVSNFDSRLLIVMQCRKGKESHAWKLT